jgi:hypothetical protein
MVDRDTSGAMCILCKGMCSLFPSAMGGALLEQAFKGHVL